MFKIKIFRKNQIPKNIKLLKDAYFDIDGYTDGKYVEAMVLDAQIVGIAFIDNQIVGIGRIVGDSVRFSYIVDLVVDKNHRRDGIGTKLVQSLAKSAKTTWVELTNDPKYPWLKEFYIKAGFKLDKGVWVFKWEK